MILAKIEDQIIKGESLLRRLWASGRDTRVLEERVKKLKLMLNKQGNQKTSSKQLLKMDKSLSKTDKKGNHDVKLLCESCLYRWIVSESYSVDKNKSYWCAKLKKRLVYLVDSCSEFAKRNR